MQNRKIVFICSPYNGDVEDNIRRARRYGRFAITKNAVPLIPHLLDDEDPEQRDLGIGMGLRILSLCQEIWVFGDRISSGMVMEIEKAKQLRIPIKHFTICCK